MCWELQNNSGIITEQQISDFKIIVNKSTVPVGTSDKVRAVIPRPLRRLGFGRGEQSRVFAEGFAVEDFIPDRIVDVYVQSAK